MKVPRETTSTVYVLDDDETICECIKDVVESIGLKAETFTRFEPFFERNLQELSGCLVLDIRMPGIDGLEIQRRLVEKGCELPVIFISAFAEVWTVVQAMKSGALDFVEKPFSSQELLSTIQAALRESSQTQQAKARRKKIDSTVQSLTPRERQILARIGLGFSNKLAAKELGLSVRTVEFHRANLKRKLGIHSREEMTTLAISCFRDEWHQTPLQLRLPGFGDPVD